MVSVLTMVLVNYGVSERESMQCRPVVDTEGTFPPSELPHRDGRRNGLAERLGIDVAIWDALQRWPNHRITGEDFQHAGV